MVAAAIVGGVVSAGVGAYGASKSASAINKSTDASSALGWEQADLAREEWDYNKNTLLPKQMQLADQNAQNQQKLTDQFMDDSAHNRQTSDEMIGQAKKSWKYQDQYMGMTDDYASGKMANTMADEANADTEQAYSGAVGAINRNAGRYGINAGSGAMAAAMGDLYTNKMLQSAGGQTMARRAARDKAEQMVGIAAGSGSAGFGTGMTAAGLATGAGAAGSSASGQGLAGYNTVANSFNAGASAAGGNMSGAARTFGGVNTDNPWGAIGTGLLTSGIKAGASNGWFTGATPAAAGGTPNWDLSGTNRGSGD
jgi:hypothetical protein